MKKQTILILFLSAMLCLTSLFVSCDQGESVDNNNKTVETTQETTEEITEEAEIEDVDVNYSSIMADWNAHLQFKNPEQKPTTNMYDGWLIFKDLDETNDQIDFSRHGNHFLVTKTTTGTNYYWETDTYVDTRAITYYIYNVNTGAEVFTATVNTYEPSKEEPEYTYDFTFFGGIYMVTVGKLTTTTETDGTETTERVYTYSYYNNDGDLMVGNSKETIHSVKHTENGDTLLYMSNKCYLLRDDEIYFVFDKGQERALPHPTFEYLGYKYIVVEGLSSRSFKVYDESFNLIVDYTTPNAEYGAYTILSNGNIFIQSLNTTPDFTDNYDFEFEGENYVLNSILVDVTTGKASELDLDFVIANLITNAEDKGTNITVNDNNQFAEIYKIADGKVATDCSFVILNNQMAEVEVLPRILKNQSEGTYFLGNGKLLISTKVYDEVFYTVDTQTHEVELFVDTTDSSYKALTNGFIYNNVVYSNDLTVLYDLTDTYNYRVNGDSILFSEYEQDSMGYITEYRKVIYVDANGGFSVNVISSNGNDDVTYYPEANCYIVRNSANEYGLGYSIYSANGSDLGSAAGISIYNVSEDGITIVFNEYDSFDGRYYTDYYFFKY